MHLNFNSVNSRVVRHELSQGGGKSNSLNSLAKRHQEIEKRSSAIQQEQSNLTNKMYVTSTSNDGSLYNRLVYKPEESRSEDIEAKLAEAKKKEEAIENALKTQNTDRTQPGFKTFG